MINKKGQSGDNNGAIIIVIIAIAIFLIFAIYFLSKMLFALGIILCIIGIILLLIGLGTESGGLALLGGAFIVVGLIVTVIGHSGVSFFEQNPTGKNLLDSANTVVNTTKDIGKGYSDTLNTINSAAKVET